MLDTGLMKHHRPCTLNPAICFCNHEAHEEKDKHEEHEEKKGVRSQHSTNASTALNGMSNVET